MKLYIDTETVGLNGPCKLIQFSIDRGPVQFIPLFEGWQNGDTWADVADLLKLLYKPEVTVVGFNLSFDLYHLYRVLHTWNMRPLDSEDRPVKPFLSKTCDLYTHVVQRGPFAPWAFSKKNGRKVVAVRKIPKVAAEPVAEYVEKLISQQVPAGVKIVRSTSAVKGRKDLVTLSWTAAASLSLKAHADHYNGGKATKIEEVWPLPPREIEKTWLPYYEESDYGPYVLACDAVLRDAFPDDWDRLADPNKDRSRGALFKNYAEDDIKYLWLVEDRLGVHGSDEIHSSNVAAVAYTRYYGFPVDLAALARTRDAYSARVVGAETLLNGVNLRSSKERLQRLRDFDPIIGSSSKATTTALAKEDTPVGRCAKAMREFGYYKQRLDQVNKVLESRTGRWHPDLRVMGTSTGRAAGTAGFNAQGIAQAEDGLGLRTAILTPWGGDFASFEIAIAASAWKDEQLLADLDAGTDVHLVTAITIHPDLVPLKLSYEEALRAKEDKIHPHYQIVKRCRTEIKRVVFGILYGAGAPKVGDVLAVDHDEAAKVIDKFFTRYAGAGRFRASEERRFCTADTESWSPSSVARMGIEASDMTGSYKRSFRFEAEVADLLWRSARLPAELSEKIPEGTVIRSPEKGMQTVHGAVRSAFMGAAIGIQRAVARAAINMPIQATGAVLTKQLLAELWEKYHIPMLNVHDELIAAGHPNFHTFETDVGKSVKEFIENKKALVKHIGFDAKRTKCWADK